MPNRAQPKEQSGYQKTILVVDDAALVRALLKRLLVLEGYKVLTAPDGKSALKIIKAAPPDMVLLDIRMPKENGMTVCQKIRQDPVTQHMPIIMITAKSEIPDKIRSLECGADDYIVKPFDGKEVKARIAVLFRICAART